ncbi:MAG: aldehyde dehydrogenase family protein [Dehalococcoidia bacterium]|nr:aldehyde dehydrogenase family protein [Dehalococcoidia bacterium]
MAATQVATHKNYIGGKWVESVTGRTYPVHNPAHTDQLVGEFQTSGAEDTRQAIEAAKDGLKTWTNTPAPTRANVIYKALEIMSRRFEELAETITIEEGKPIADARGEVKRAMAIMEYAAGEGRRMFGYTTPSEMPDTVAYTTRRPLGIVGIITPWNFPLAIPAWKIAPALICGNSLVFKPASATPHSAVKLLEIYEEAGLPAGVLNLVTGPGGQVGNALVESPDVKGISFTGSTEIGTDLYSESAKRLKKVQAEMGGKNAVIVLSDADMDKAMNGIVQGAFGSTGQRCTATSRVIVEESVHDQFVKELIDRTSKLTVGDGLDPSNDVAPLSSQNQKDKVLEFIGVGTEEGAELAFGGRDMTDGELNEGYYVEPTVFTGVTSDMRIAQEEIFGPVLTVFKAKDIKDAIEIANSVEFGLSSSVYTKDITKAYEYINTVETGMVHVNASTLGGEVHLPFGGLNSSGVGQREQGTAAVDFFSEVITVYIDHAAEAS